MKKDFVNKTQVKGKELVKISRNQKYVFIKLKKGDNAMPKTISIRIANDHIERISRVSAKDALAELVWNALDADADEVSIVLNRNELGGIDQIEIIDNGHGIEYERVEELFGYLGNSQKRRINKSPKGRDYHGKFGRGRYRGFALGSQIIWKSVYCDYRNNIEIFDIIGNDSDLTKFIATDKIDHSGERTGVHVTINAIDYNKSKSLADNDTLIEELTVIFAPYILAYPTIKIVFDGKRIDPMKKIKDISEYRFSNDNLENLEADVVLKIIEWKGGTHRELYLCSQKGIALEEEQSPLQDSKYSHTVYVLSSYFEELFRKNELLLREIDTNYLALKEKFYKIIQEHYDSKQSENTSEVIQEYKDENIYPYDGTPKSLIEATERHIFDMCAFTIHKSLPGFPKAPKANKKLTLRLLKQALEQNPTELKRILVEVLDLPAKKLQELAEILEKTSLKAVINTAKMVTDRLMFLNALEQILFEPIKSKKLKERSQLHKILLGELWIFGEHYTYGCDDVTLKNVLVQYLNFIDRKELTPEIPEEDLKNLNDIPDLCLWQQYMIDSDRLENLVIELKRPTCTISSKEVAQIKRYAMEISSCKWFDKEKTRWLFLLIGTEMDDLVTMECQQADREFGHILKSHDVNIWVKKWSQIIHDAKIRYNFLKEKLEYSVKDNNEGLQYLKEKYSKIY